MNKTNNKKAFTLIELIIYLAIATISFAIAVNIGINLTVSQAGNSAKNEVYFNARLIVNQLQYQFNQAKDITTASCVFNDDEGVMVLEKADPAGYIIFDTYDKQITSGGRQFTIKKLRIKVGEENYIDLTSDKVTVTRFRISNLTRATEPKSLKIELALESLNTSNDPKYAGSIDIETSLSIKR